MLRSLLALPSIFPTWRRPARGRCIAVPEADMYPAWHRRICSSGRTWAERREPRARRPTLVGDLRPESTQPKQSLELNRASGRGHDSQTAGRATSSGVTPRRGRARDAHPGEETARKGDRRRETSANECPKSTILGIVTSTAVSSRCQGIFFETKNQ